MSDENITETTTESTETSTELQSTEKEIDWKAQARKWESRAKEALSFKEEAERWREYEASQKSEHEKLADELAKAKSEASESASRLMRYEIAAQKGISADALDLINGSTREELEAAADKLLSLIADQSKPKSPKPDENQGKPASSVANQLTREDLKGMTDKQIMEAKAAGRLDELLGKL